MNDQSGIQWPEHYHPQNCPVHVRNELDMAAKPEQIWAWLVRAPLWPNWYVNSANLRLLETAGTELKPGTRFRWKTFGITITSTVLEYVPNERLAWDAKGLGVDAYHAWLLRPSTNGCDVLTEETQHGWLACLSQLFLPNRMSKYHQIWLESLQGKALSGLPDGD
ncbi:SRPBCC domain-containing protein [Methylomonas albis]|uniref:SRPBCC domain-containing protein n=1 Tax=Methylomonas albis TaxID=1854563 RepID=A0ABR9D9X1_9GAMM|nr:SRPBCC domain-containing protein [Methylomonas albis]MBD9358687.1 SRPBCC domain-containing protein [Methylomonas albis]